LRKGNKQANLSQLMSFSLSHKTKLYIKEQTIHSTETQTPI